MLSRQAGPRDPDNFPFVVLGNKIDLDSRVVRRRTLARAPRPWTNVRRVAGDLRQPSLACYRPQLCIASVCPEASGLLLTGAPLYFAQVSQKRSLAWCQVTRRPPTSPDHP